MKLDHKHSRVIKVYSTNQGKDKTSILLCNESLKMRVDLFVHPIII